MTDAPPIAPIVDVFNRDNKVSFCRRRQYDSMLIVTLSRELLQSPQAKE